MILTTTIIHAYYFDDSFKNPYIEFGFDIWKIDKFSFFKIKLQAVKRDLRTDFFLWVLRYFSEYVFNRTLVEDCFWKKNYKLL